MSNSCSIIGRCRNRFTGELTNKLSLLHQDLLEIGKTNRLFNRLKANKAFYLSHSDKFLNLYDGDLIFSSEDADAEPILASFYEVALGIMPEVKLGDIRNLLAKKFHEGVYSFEDARDKMISFNKEMHGARTFMGTIKRLPNGKYKFEVTYNAIDEQQLLMLTIADKNFIDIIVNKLEKLGIAIEKGDTSFYSTEKYNRLANGLVGIVRLKEGQSITSDLAKETGHAIVGTLGTNNPLVKRLMAIAEKHPEIFNDLLGDAEYTLLEDLPEEKRKRELVGHLIGKYLEDTKNFDKISVKESIKNLIDRIVQYIKSRFAFTDRDYKLALYDAKYLAYKAVREFMGSNFKGTLENALNSKETLNAEANKLKAHLLEAILNLNIISERAKDWGYNIHKSFKDTFDELVTLYNEVGRLIRENGNIFITDHAIQEKIIELVLKSTKFLLNRTKEAQAELMIALNGIHPLTGQPVPDNEVCKIIRKNELLFSEISRLYNNWATIQNSFTHSTESGENLKEQLAIMRDSLSLILFDIKTQSASGSDVVSKGYSLLISEARRKLAGNLLCEINGNEFIALELHVSLAGLTKIHRHKDTIINLRNELTSTEFNPPMLWLSRWITSMADSPSAINQLIKAVVELKKHEANVKALTAKDTLFDLYLKLRAYGISDTSIFMEKAFNGELTGNIISERNWGEWEKRRREDYIEWRDKWWESNKHLFSNRREAYGDVIFTEAKGAFIASWHAKNSVQIEASDTKGDVRTDEEGNPILYWAPAISSDEKASGKTLYNNQLYEKLVNSAELKDLKALIWLKEYMQFKRGLDELLPPGSTNAFGVRAPLFQGTFTNKLRGSLGGKIGAKQHIKRVGGVTWRHFIMLRLAENPNDTEFGGEHNTYDDEDLLWENELIFTNAHINALNSIERVPIYGVKKLKDLYTISTDLIHSTLAYSAMAYNYECLELVIDLVEVLRKQMMDLKANNQYTIHDLIENKRSKEVPAYYHRMNDYIDMLVYNCYVNPNFKKLNKYGKKVLNFITGYGSAYFLLFNIHSAVTNALTGLWEMTKESLGNEEFGFKEFGFAFGCYICFFVQKVKNRLFNTIIGQVKGNKGSDNESRDFMTLFLKRFDDSNDNLRKFRDYHIETPGYLTMLGYNYINLVMLPYTITDDWMLAIAYIATAKKTKLINKNGEESSVWDAYEVKNGQLRLKPIINGAGEEEDAEWKILDKNQDALLKIFKDDIENDTVPESYLKAVYEHNEAGLIMKDGKKVVRSVYVPWDTKAESVFKTRCRSINNRLHGIYNTDDAGAFLGLILGPAMASLKKYAIGLIDRRFSFGRYDLRERKWRLGSLATIATLAVDYLFATDKGVIKIDPEKDKRFVLGKRALNAIVGALLFAAIISSGGWWATSILKERGYSENQIANIRRFWGDNIIPEILRCLLYLTAPPDERDKTQGSLTIKALLKLGIIDKRENSEWDENPWFEGASDVLLDGYLWGIKNLQFNLGKELTDDDNVYLSKENFYIQALKYEKTIPFSIKGILHYLLYRCLIELEAYRIGILPPNLYGLISEYKNLTSNDLVSVSALIDTGKLLLLLSEHKSLEDLLEIAEKKNLKPETIFKKYSRDGQELYTRGINAGFKKGALHGIKVGPFRTGATHVFGYTAKRNQVWWRGRALGLGEPNED